MPAPTDISGLVHRFRASQLTGLTDGSSVSSAAFETGGITLLQSTTANQPTFITSSINGLASLRFNGTSTNINGSIASPLSQPFTLTVIIRISGATGVRQIIDGNTQYLFNYDAGKYSFYAGSLISGSTVSVGTHVLTTVVSGGSGSMYLDGAVIASGTVGTRTIDRYNLGSQGTSQYFNGDISEIITYNKSLTRSELTTLDTYIQAVYAIPMADAISTTSVNRFIRANDLTSKLIASAEYRPSNVQASNYTLALSDVAKIVEITNGVATTVTIPTNATAAFPIGTTLQIMQYGSGRVQIAAASGVTTDAAGGLYAAKQYSVISLRKRATDEWVVFGDTAAS